ncbi:nicotinate (nicotinamide) nucleotide adenylyltransferase [Paenibacillus sp. 598K]|uniref:nicotinate-nucleotide adenylyltransferase n=1 Tax=Paenibacillus sp. 598K TaxID=1117987 RepID=UPI000FF924DF|nr:nicotinate-nucleotide adenylyltransferase [Paenibacillus sp. 598K]GBF73723.1 nicotinate (nicotinamide) nucleotide adenylyltransferase [Paenibacillus sp. 598K]
MIQVGLMGGTFDPIHLGHLLAAESAREACGLDEVWFIPAATPPLKDHAPRATAEERLEMVYRGIDFQPHFRAMALELERGGTSYTIDTVQALREAYPGREFSFILGADRVNDLKDWHRIEELAELISFIAVERPGATMDTSQLPAAVRERVKRCEMPLIDISSTDIRTRREDGRSIRFLVPDKVYQFIRRNELYGS